MGGSSKNATVGYKYYLGMHMILCHGPVDNVNEIKVDGKVAWSGSIQSGSIAVNAESLFGGEDREGGVSGAVEIQSGESTQTANPYLVSKLGSMVPGYRGVLGAILKQCYVGMNPYVKRWAFRATRIYTRQNGLAQWYSEKAAIGSDMNPSHIVRECLTDPDWGMGYPDSAIDEASFVAVANTLHSEGLGISLLWDKSKDLSDFIQDILSHIQGSLYVSRSTGKFVFKLTRADYSVGSLVVLDENSITKITAFKRSSVGELINSVTVVYWDSDTGNDGSVTVQDIALISQQQSVISTTKQYPGFTNGANAVRAASTELRALSTPLASATIYTDRTAAHLNVGDCFILSWPRYGVSQLVCRVLNVELGSLGSNIIKLTVIEDVFAQSSAVYAPPPTSQWESHISAPQPCPFHCLIEAPYWELVQRMGETLVNDVASTSTFFVVTGTRPTTDAVNAKLYSNPNFSGFVDYGAVDFCATALLAQAIHYNDTISIPITGSQDLDTVEIGSYAILGDEIVSVQALSSSHVTIGRGCLDTVPAIHDVGTRIFFADRQFASDNTEYAIGETAKIKLLPVTGLGRLDISAATELNLTAVGRAHRPYPPAGITINGLSYPDQVLGLTSVSWHHRDRTLQLAQLVDQTAGNIGPEIGVTYSIRLFNHDTGVQLHEVDGLTDTTYTGLPSPTGHFNMRIELWSSRSGLTSMFKHSYVFDYFNITYLTSEDFDRFITEDGAFQFTTE